MWLIARTLHQPVHNSLLHASVYPHTLSYCCRKQMQVDSYMELPKSKRPPKDMWDKPEELDRWFDQVFGREKQTGVDVIITDIEG